MRFMVMVKANEDSEAGVLPSKELLTEMGRYNEELVKAGVMLMTRGSSRARRARACGSPGRSGQSSTGPSPRPRS